MRQSRFWKCVGSAGRDTDRRRLAPAVLALLAALALGAVPAGAAEGPDPRGEYADRAEPICERNVRANKRIFRGAEGEVRRGQLKKASRHFFRASRAFGKTIRQLVRIPRPAVDRDRLKRWFGLLREEKKLVLRIGKALRSGKKKQAERISLALNRNSNRANNTVLPFGFDYCRLEQSRFG